MNDLVYAPPSFVNADGQRVVFVDFIHARYCLELDAAARTASACSEIRFNADTEGLAAISMTQPVTSACLDGRDVKLDGQYSPDGQTSFKVLSTPVLPGTHVLGIKSALTEPGPYGDPITWLSHAYGVDCAFQMSDLRRSDGGYLEAFLPSNYNFDHFRMSFSVAVFNASVPHLLFSNGAVSTTSCDRWTIEFPSFFTSACPWFHLVPAAAYQALEDGILSSNGRKVPILVYTKSGHDSAQLLKDFVHDTKKILQQLEVDFGPFPHGSVTVFAKGNGKGGMEYAGATATYLESLRHELDHSYFGRSIMPVNGDAGWIDEAVACWGDDNYRCSEKPPKRGANLGRRSDYIRITHRDAYTVGRDFLAHLDHVLRDRGGPTLKLFLKEYAARKRHQSVTAAEFQELLEDFHGASLQELFECYVYSQ